MPICAVCEVKPKDTFFCRKRVRVLLFSSRVRRVYFGDGYFHRRNRSSEIAAVWCVFQHLSFRLLSQWGQATTMARKLCLQEWIQRRHSSLQLRRLVLGSKNRFHSRFAFLDSLGMVNHLRSWLNKGLFHTGFCLRKTKKATDKVALISERYLAGGLSCLLKASLV